MITQEGQTSLDQPAVKDVKCLLVVTHASSTATETLGNRGGHELTGDGNLRTTLSLRLHNCKYFKFFRYFLVNSAELTSQHMVIKSTLSVILYNSVEF